METFLTENLIIEGPDCSGKSSLYRNIHRATNHKWNIQDRSQLSMLCYAIQYGRDEKIHRELLKRELSNLNNRLIVLLPSKEEITKRLSVRGDEFQNETSILELWEIFRSETDKIKNLTNVLVLEKNYSEEELVTEVIDYINFIETLPPSEIGNLVKMWVLGSGELETVLDLRVFLDSSFSDEKIMEHPKESEYYSSIKDDCLKIIENEIIGNNLYGKPQDLSSRRFFYSSDSCISSIHFLPRNSTLKVLCSLRSTDVERNAEADLTFLSHLSGEILRYFSWPCSRIILWVRFNSAHVRWDLR